MPGWFEQNAPPSVAPSAAGWFARNAPGSTASEPADERSYPFGIPKVVGDVALGAAKGLGHTATGFGKLIHKIPGVTTAIDTLYGQEGLSDAAFDEADRVLTPTNTAEKVGFGLEQAAEFLIPAGAAEKAAAAATAKLAPKFTNAPRLVQAAVKLGPRIATEAASAAGVATAHGDDSLTAGAIGAAVPLAGTAVKAVAPKLMAGAEHGVEQFLGATKERFKAMGQRIAPEMLRRGIRGSRAQVAEQAATAAENAGQAIDGALQQFGARKVGTTAVVDALETAKDAFRTTRELTPIEALRAGHAEMLNGRLTFKGHATMNANGMVELPVVFEPRAVRQLDSLQSVIRQLGPDARVDQMVAIRRAWDKVVSQAGGFQHRAPGAIGMPLKDTTEAWAKREGAGAIRKLLDAEVPELTALNKEFAFWKNLDDVLSQTMQRTGPHGPGLISAVKEGAGQAVGAAAHGGLGTAFAVGKLAKLLDSAFRSPRWQLASAQMKDRLAHSLMNNRSGEAAAILARLTAGGASQVAAAPRSVKP